MELELPKLTEHQIEAIRAISLPDLHRTLVDSLEETEITLPELCKYMLLGLAILGAKRGDEA